MPNFSDLIQHAADRLFRPWVLVLLMGVASSSPCGWDWCRGDASGRAWGDVMNRLPVFLNRIGLIGLSGLATMYAKRKGLQSPHHAPD